MRQDWEIRKIGDVCDLMTGGTPSREKLEYFGGDIRWLVSGDIHAKEIFECEGRITHEGMRNSNAKILPLNSVMIALNGQGKTKGSVSLLRTKATCNQSLVCIIPKDPSKLLPEFLYANLHGRYQEIRRLTGDDDKERRGLNMPIIRNINIPIAPIHEQQRIVAILDEAFDGIATAKANAEKNLKNARELFESHLQSVFTQRGKGWVGKPLGNYCDLLNGFAFKSSDVVLKSDTQLVRMGNLYGNKLSLDRSAVFYPDVFATEYQKYLLREGDIVMSLTGTTGKEDYGYAVRIPECEHKLLMNQRIVKFDSIREEEIDRHYLLHFLRSRTFLDVLYPTANGTRQANLSSTTIKTLSIPICSITEQRKIANSFEVLSDEIESLETIYKQKIAALDELKKSLLHNAFSGTL